VRPGPVARRAAGVERAAVGITHADAGAVLAGLWKLPPLLATPIGKHHATAGVTDPGLRKLTELTHLAGRCADVFVDDRPADPIAAVRQLCRDQHGLTEADADALLNEVGTATRETAALFEINIGSPADYEAVLRRANEALVDLTLQSQAHATALEQQATALAEQASTLARQNEQLRARADTDALTGLANRARFDQFLAEQFHVAADGGRPLSLLLLDVDRFKAINDQHGHPAGDRVLAGLGRLLATAARAQDLPARYGGRNWCWCSRTRPGRRRRPWPRASAGRSAGADPGRPRRAAAGGDGQRRGGHVRAGRPVPVGRPPGQGGRPAMYAAKRAGRNCVRVFSAARPAAA
jgi:hypothetical protein